MENEQLNPDDLITAEERKNQSSSFDIDPVIMGELAIELGKGALDIGKDVLDQVSAIVTNIDLSL